ncbi:TetR/AcrR family transcriptional regulator [Pradoshia sp.]
MTSHLGTRELAKKKRRETILEEAEKLFLHKGIDNTTMDEIAKEAGIGIATLFRYFPKKEIIIETVATAKLQILLDALKEIEQQTSSCMEMVTAVMDFFIGQMSEQNGAMPKLLDNFVNYKAVAIDSFDDLNRYQEMRDEISIVFTRMIETRKNDGSIKQDLSATQILSTILSNFSVFTFKLSLKGNENLPAPELTSEEQLVIMKRIFLDYLRP